MKRENDGLSHSEEEEEKEIPVVNDEENLRQSEIASAQLMELISVVQTL